MNPRKYTNLRAPGVVTTPYGGKTRGEAVHPGVDFANKKGSPISAFEDGVVMGVGPTTNGMGNIVTLKDRDGSTHQYGHLQSMNVRPGQKVKKGQQIAKMGATGGTSYSPSGGPADHLDVRIVDAYGRFKNPLNYLKNQ